MTPIDRDQGRERGDRAEEVANWYFRLNGFLLTPGFIVHPDQPRSNPRTEADLLGVRFPHSVEHISRIEMPDDRWITRLSKGERALFVLVEVKAGRCDINGPWSCEHERNMNRAISRLGMVGTEAEVDAIADAMYRSLRWENDRYVLQYISVGSRHYDPLSA